MPRECHLGMRKKIKSDSLFYCGPLNLMDGPDYELIESCKAELKTKKKSWYCKESKENCHVDHLAVR